MKLNQPGVLGQLVLAAALGAATFSAAVPAGAQQNHRIALDAPLPPTIVTGQVIVHFRPGIPDDARDQSLAAVGGVFMLPLELQDAILARVPPGTEISAAQSLEVDPNVVSAEPNGNLRTSELR